MQGTAVHDQRAREPRADDANADESRPDDLGGTEPGTHGTQGAAELRAWRRHVVAFAWPTVVFAGVIVVAFATVVASAVVGAIPLWLGFLLNTVVAYAAFTPGHEAAHWNIAGRHSRFRWLNEACGWISMAIMFDNFAVLRAAHMQHHAHTNDPEKDPDYFVPDSSAFRVLVRSFVLFSGYLRDYVADTKRKPNGRRRRLGALCFSGGLVAIAIGLGAAGYLREVLALWVLPAPAAFLILALVFDYLPHRPHRSVERYTNTKIILFPGLNTLLLGQNYHLIHHLYPAVPFYRMGACFRDVRSNLVAHGAPIVDLTGAPAPR